MSVRRTYTGVSRAALEALRALAPVVLYGEGFWRRPPATDFLAALGGATEDELSDVEGLRTAIAAAGFEILHESLADDRDWSRYEETLADNAEREGSPESRAYARRIRERRALPGGTDTLGFGLFVLRRRSVRPSMPWPSVDRRRAAELRRAACRDERSRPFHKITHAAKPCSLPLTLLAFSDCRVLEEDAVRDVVKNYTKAFSERDAKTVCKLLIPKAQMLLSVGRKRARSPGHHPQSLENAASTAARAASANAAVHLYSSNPGNRAMPNAKAAATQRALPKDRRPLGNQTLEHWARACPSGQPRFNSPESMLVLVGDHPAVGTVPDRGVRHAPWRRHKPLPNTTSNCQASPEGPCRRRRRRALLSGHRGVESWTRSSLSPDLRRTRDQCRALCRSRRHHPPSSELLGAPRAPGVIGRDGRDVSRVRCRGGRPECGCGPRRRTGTR